MGLLGKLFGGSDKKGDKSGSSRAKRGRAPSIRQIAPGDAGTQEYSEQAPAPLPDISLDEIEKQTVAKPAPQSAEDAIQIDFSVPDTAAKPKPRPDRQPTTPPKGKPPAPPPGAPVRKEATTSTPVPSPRRSTRSQTRQKPLGEILIQEQLASTEQVTRAVKIQENGGKGLLGQLLVNIGACQQNAVAQALSRQFLISTVELDRAEIRPEAAAVLPVELCRTHRLIPFEKLGKMLCVAMANCLNRKAINEIEELTKLKVKPFNCTWIEIRKAIENIHSVSGASAAQPEPGTAGAKEPAAPSVAAAPAEPEEFQLASDMDTGQGTASGSDEERRPFAGPARAVIEGLDGIGDQTAEVVETTERGLASRHLAERQARREERAKVMGSGKGVVGRLIAPDIDKMFQAIPDGVPEVIDLRQADDAAVEGLEFPEADELAPNIAEFAAQAALAAAATAETTPAAPVATDPEAELEPVHGATAGYSTSPQVDTVAAAESVATDMPAPGPAATVPPPPMKLDPIPVSDTEWAGMEADYEPDPVIAWEATYTPQGAALARVSLD